MTKMVLEEARRRALERVRRSRAIPTLVGHVATELNCSLKEAEHLLLELVDSHLIRPITKIEMREHDLREGFLPV
jgi:hypothetical protein